MIFTPLSTKIFHFKYKKTGYPFIYTSSGRQTILLAPSSSSHLRKKSFHFYTNTARTLFRAESWRIEYTNVDGFFMAISECLEKSAGTRIFFVENIVFFFLIVKLHLSATLKVYHTVLKHFERI